MHSDAGTIVVGYDGSPEADGALRWAVGTADLEGHRVRAVVVDQSGEGRHALSRAEALLARSDVPGTSELHAGHVIPVLLREAREAAMLLLGSRGHGWAADATGRSVSQQLARRAPCPVVVARAALHPGADRIVVGVDGSRQSRAALEFACRRATTTRESVVAVHAWRPGRANVDGRGQLSSRLAGRAHEAELALDRYVGDLASLYPDVDLTQESIAVPAAVALADTSAGASLVVTGCRGRGVMSGVLFGSVSHHLLHQARCPVAVVH